MLSTNTITLNSGTKASHVVWHNNQFNDGLIDTTKRTASGTNWIKN